MLERGKNERGGIEMVDAESLVPAEHLFRQVDAAVDFEGLYEIAEPLYSEDEGRRSIDPAEGKHFYVYTVAGAAKFLRVYYARVKEGQPGCPSPVPQ